MDNPQAFPSSAPMYKIEDGVAGIVSEDGMTLRDYFAGQALPSLIRQLPLNRGCISNKKDEYAEFMARLSYEYADAMLQERQKEPSQQPIKDK